MGKQKRLTEITLKEAAKTQILQKTKLPTLVLTLVFSPVFLTGIV